MKNSSLIDMRLEFFVWKSLKLYQIQITAQTNFYFYLAKNKQFYYYFIKGKFLFLEVKK